MIVSNPEAENAPANLILPERALYYALNHKPGAETRWAELRAKGEISDTDLHAAISAEFSPRSGGEKGGLKFSYSGGDTLKFYFNRANPKSGGQPTLQGKRLMAAARGVLGLAKAGKKGAK